VLPCYFFRPELTDRLELLADWLYRYQASRPMSHQNRSVAAAKDVKIDLAFGLLARWPERCPAQEALPLPLVGDRLN